jgi:glutaredoxin 3
MYSTERCPFCLRAEQLLQRKGVRDVRKIMVDRDPKALEAMLALTRRRTVPQIYIADRHVGGFDDLEALDRAGVLDAILAP